MDWRLVVSQSVVMGLVLSAVLTVLILVSLKINPEMWYRSYPPDVKAAWGPMSEKARRQRILFAVPFFGVTVLALVAAGVRLGDVLGAPPSFVALFASAAIIFAVFNIVDAVIIDWLILSVLWPSLGVLPGTEGMAGYRDMRLWTANFAKGFVVSAVVGLLAGGIGSLVVWLGSIV